MCAVTDARGTRAWHSRTSGGGTRKLTSVNSASGWRRGGLSEELMVRAFGWDVRERGY